jgi:hypothetical protein
MKLQSAACTFYQVMENKPRTKDYMDILNDLYMEQQITKQEYDELKKKYEYNLQHFS